MARDGPGPGAPASELPPYRMTRVAAGRCVSRYSGSVDTYNLRSESCRHGQQRPGPIPRFQSRLRSVADVTWQSLEHFKFLFCLLTLHT